MFGGFSGSFETIAARSAISVDDALRTFVGEAARTGRARSVAASTAFPLWAETLEAGIGSGSFDGAAASGNSARPVSAVEGDASIAASSAACGSTIVLVTAVESVSRCGDACEREPPATTRSAPANPLIKAVAANATIPVRRREGGGADRTGRTGGGNDEVTPN
ncbi:MAG: hypothetical protein HOW73_24705 [Polyangiaceae bacterium]|nr:hypothetical protein [Polyangiaceae bacterium]